MTQKGKTWLIAVSAFVALAAFIVIGICCNDKDDPVVAPTFDELVLADYAESQALDTEADTAYFYEVHATLNGPVSEVPAGELKVIAMESVWQFKDTCTIKTRNTLEAEASYEKVNDWWVGSMAINPNDFVLSFEDAVVRLHEANNIVLPDGDKMTIRRPTHPMWTAPMYIFGTMGSGFVYINAMTGEVGVIE